MAGGHNHQASRKTSKQHTPDGYTSRIQKHAAMHHRMKRNLMQYNLALTQYTRNQLEGHKLLYATEENRQRYNALTRMRKGMIIEHGEPLKNGGYIAAFRSPTDIDLSEYTIQARSIEDGMMVRIVPTKLLKK